MAIPLKYNVRNLFVRKATTLATAGGIGLVVVVIILLLALMTGFQQMLVSTGSPDNMVVLRKGATSDAMSFASREAMLALRHLPGIAMTPENEPLMSPELIAQPLLQAKGSGQEMGLVRGVMPVGYLVHENVRFVAGRAPRSSMNEVAVGVAAARRYENTRLGETLQFGRRTWTVVGVFTADGSAFESEIWVDVDDLLKDTNRNGYSGARLTVAPRTDRDALIRRIAEDQRISLEAKPEVSYYNEQAEGAQTLYVLISVLAVIMATGAIFGAMNTMFTAVAYRTAEIGTLRALGFSRRAILTSFVSESLCVALLGYLGGALLGIGAVFLINHLMHGIAFRLPSFSTALVTLQVSPPTLAITFALAAAMGFVGGLLPARRAARLRVTEALRKA
jgi:ABC-type lipoprotein release transport system permease subunit